MFPTFKSSAAALVIGGCTALGVVAASASTPAHHASPSWRVAHLDPGTSTTVEHAMVLAALARSTAEHQGLTRQDEPTPSTEPSDDPSESDSPDPTESDSPEPTDTSEPGDDNDQGEDQNGDDNDQGEDNSPSSSPTSSSADDNQGDDQSGDDNGGDGGSNDGGDGGGSDG